MRVNIRRNCLKKCYIIQYGNLMQFMFFIQSINVCKNAYITNVDFDFILGWHSVKKPQQQLKQFYKAWD